MSWMISVLASNTLLAALLGCLAWTVWKLLRSPVAAHALWVAALIKLITPPLVTVPLEVAPFAMAGEHRVESSLQRPASGSDLRGAPPGMELQSPAFRASSSTKDRASNVAWEESLLLVWVLGSAVYFLFTGIRILHFQRKLRQWRSAPGPLQKQACSIAGRLGLRRTPPILVSEERTSPAVWAFLGSPRILLPLPLIARLEGNQLETLLAHELSHVLRGDHWLRRLEWLIKGILWWNPVAWLASRGIRASEELCCDALVVRTLPGSTRSYATALLEAVDYLSAEAPVPLRVGLAPVRLLERRIMMIAGRSFSSKVPGPIRVLLLGLVLSLLPLSLVAAARTPQEPAPAPPSAQKQERALEEEEDWREVLREAMAQVREAIAKARISPQVREALNQSREEIRAAMHELRSKREAIREEFRQSIDRDEIRTRIREALEKTRRLTDEERKRIIQALSELKIDEIVDSSLEAALAAVDALDVDRIVESVMSEIDIEAIVESSLEAVEEALSKLEREKRQN